MLSNIKKYLPCLISKRQKNMQKKGCYRNDFSTFLLPTKKMEPPDLIITTHHSRRMGRGIAIQR